MLIARAAHASRPHVLLPHPELRQLAPAQPRQLGQPHIGQLDTIAQHLQGASMPSAAVVVATLDACVASCGVPGGAGGACGDLCRLRIGQRSTQPISRSTHQAREAGQGGQLRNAIVRHALAAAQADAAQRGQQAHPIQLPVLQRFGDETCQLSVQQWHSTACSSSRLRRQQQQWAGLQGADTSAAPPAAAGTGSAPGLAGRGSCGQGGAEWFHEGQQDARC